MVSNPRSAPRGLQQQPRRESDPQQQRAGATDFQSGFDLEGRRWHNSLGDYLGRREVQADAQAGRETKSIARAPR